MVIFSRDEYTQEYAWRMLVSQFRLKSFTALSFVKAKAHWLTFEKAILFQASLLATHPDKALNRGAL